MRTSGRTQSRVDRGMIIIASVLLLAIVILAAGHFTGNRITFYAGLSMTLAGVLTGIQRLTTHGTSWGKKG